MPEISVILPTYQHRETVCHAIQSVLNQSYRDFELIIIDDGSTDGTNQIINDHASNDHRIKVYRNELNSGRPALICNQAVREYASGEYIAFQFDDDLWFNWCLEYLRKGIQGYDFVYGQSVYIDFATKKILDTLGRIKIDKQNILSGNKLANNAVLLKKTVFLEAGGFDDNVLLKRVCDWELWIRILYRNYLVNQLPNVVSTCYLFSPNSISDTVPYNVKAVLQYIFDKFHLEGEVWDNQWKNYK